MKKIVALSLVLGFVLFIQGCAVYPMPLYGSSVSFGYNYNPRPYGYRNHGNPGWGGHHHGGGHGWNGGGYGGGHHGWGGHRDHY